MTLKIEDSSTKKALFWFTSSFENKEIALKAQEALNHLPTEKQDFLKAKFQKFVKPDYFTLNFQPWQRTALRLSIIAIAVIFSVFFTVVAPELWPLAIFYGALSLGALLVPLFSSYLKTETIEVFKKFLQKDPELKKAFTDLLTLKLSECSQFLEKYPLIPPYIGNQEKEIKTALIEKERCETLKKKLEI